MWSCPRERTWGVYYAMFFSLYEIPTDLIWHSGWWASWGAPTVPHFLRFYNSELLNATPIFFYLNGLPSKTVLVCCQCHVLTVMSSELYPTISIATKEEMKMHHSLLHCFHYSEIARKLVLVKLKIQTGCSGLSLPFWSERLCFWEREIWQKAEAEHRSVVQSRTGEMNYSSIQPIVWKSPEDQSP